MEAKAQTWKERCIQEFDLRPLPLSWNEKVVEQTEEASERYYLLRKKGFARKAEVEDREESDLDDSDDEGTLEGLLEGLLEELRDKLEDMSTNIFGEDAPWKWQTSLSAKDLTWDAYSSSDRLMTGTFQGLVWSPYAIPRAVSLEHYYYRRPSMRTMSFRVEWSYKLLNFEADGVMQLFEAERKWTVICANGYDNERLRLDCIVDRNLTRATIRLLKSFLCGAKSNKTDLFFKDAICSDFDFILLVFASMGTIDFESIKCIWMGYQWPPSSRNQDDLCNKMIKEKAIETKEEFENLECVSWLEYRIRKITKNLRPTDKFYHDPTNEDAPGYDPELDFSDETRKQLMDQEEKRLIDQLMVSREFSSEDEEKDARAKLEEYFSTCDQLSQKVRFASILRDTFAPGTKRRAAEQMSSSNKHAKRSEDVSSKRT
ncbi:hypothetical protein SEMRO_1339_G264290.1 [Seminavis robusta]|uniref:Uncharacterized protein n=1 Tax=Seminavis robusta TaxID=568900 RepID=A0A9N8EMJ5_9STRA|nr:hypothetical protein SEMRO_1339_G264290.1 [Seminavis robusta]|eukprot:Sro1339_g264290.1 n/a (430) ;mRNA; f:14777-16066